MPISSCLPLVSIATIRTPTITTERTATNDSNNETWNYRQQKSPLQTTSPTLFSTWQARKDTR